MPKSSIPEGKTFDKRWMALTEEERKDLSRIASSGTTHPDPAKTALVGGLALVQLDRLKRWWMWLIAPVFAGLAVMFGDLLGAGQNWVLGAALTFAGWALLWWQRRQFLKALKESRDRLET